jgi:serine/threonine-protein kinase SRK2
MASTHPLVAGGGGGSNAPYHHHHSPHNSLLDPFAHHPYLDPIGNLSRGAANTANAALSAASSRLVLARDRRTGEHVAVKLIPRGWDDPARPKLAARELLLHQALSLGRHPHVVGFREAFLSPTHLCVAMEYVERGEDLQTFLANTGGR